MSRFRRQRRMWILLLVCGTLLITTGYVYYRQRFSPTSRFIFLYVRETNNALLRGVPSGPVSADFPVWSADRPSLIVPRNRPFPPSQTRLFALHEIEQLDVLVQARSRYVSHLPSTVPVAKAVRWQPGAHDVVGMLDDRVQVVDEGRFVPKRLLVQSISDDASVTLVVDGDTVRLAPGDTWAIASGPVDGVVQSVQYGPRWENFITGQLDRSLPLTVMTIHNLGWLPRTAVSRATGVATR